MALPIWLKCTLLVAGSVFITAICFLIQHYINRKVAQKDYLRELQSNAFRINEQRFRQLIENVSGISIQGYDENRTVIFWNKASTALYGYSEEEALGAKLENLIIPEPMREIVIEAVDRWVEYGEEVPDGELELIDKNGNIVPVYSSHVLLETSRGKEMFCLDINLDPIRHTEESLRKSEELLSTIFNTAQDAIFIKNTHCRYQKINPAFARLFGKSEEDIIGRTDEELLRPDESEKNLKIDRQVLRGETVEDFLEKKINGDVRFFHTIKVPVGNEKDNITGLCGIVRDITRQRRSEKTISTLFAISNAVNTAGDLDELYKSIHKSLGTIIDVTNFFIALVDNKKKMLHFPYSVDTMDEDSSPILDFAPEKTLTGEVLFRGKPILFKELELASRGAANRIVGTVPLIWMGAPLVIHNEVIGVVAVQSYTDPFLYNEEDLKVLSLVSDQMAIAIERKRTEEALKESEKRYRYLFNNAPAGMCELDFAQGKFTRVNEQMCRFTGYTEEELLTMDARRLLHEKSAESFLKEFGKFASGEVPGDKAEYIILKKDGEEINVVINTDFSYQGKKVTGARIVVHDITELKKIESEKMAALNIAAEHEKLALVGQIAGKMAHDFNNILGVIMGNTELSLLECKDERIKKTLELIFEQTLRGKNLTRNLVAFARDQEPKQEFFRVSEKIDLVLSLLKKDLEGIEIIRDDQYDMPELLADPGMIEHALVNMILNSIHALTLETEPRIILRTSCAENSIRIEIEDNGCGIPSEYLDRIYDPSFTLKGTKDVTGSYREGVKGTGYGMANVKKYIEQHRGTIEVESEFGCGVKFTIKLPVREKELTPEEKEEIQKEVNLFNQRILLVEDEQAISEVQYRLLTGDPCNHKVDIASNGEKAIELFNNNNYDCVSLDYVLPGEITGMNVYNHIRKMDQNIPVLFSSGNIEFLESTKELQSSDPYVDHLSKPFQNKIYVSCLHRLMEKSARNRSELL
ncbi:hybrid sensor histidine kinase/response regulator [Desulfomarina profundi]|uniref:histidine kinase n=2 Tax=Desulfomarina profundi TaxID=2772557 RepID=A0A8D5FI33_9BACT|nr:hybrid sensor histidine kinase/response regulator [Desulfomarina profundi]